jgi:hypothetical protein
LLGASLFNAYPIFLQKNYNCQAGVTERRRQIKFTTSPTREVQSGNIANHRMMGIAPAEKTARRCRAVMEKLKQELTGEVLKIC